LARAHLAEVVERADRDDSVLAKLTEWESDPLGYGTAALVSRPERRRLRIGDYRVVYTIDNGALAVWVVHVGHRATVYDT